MDEERRGEEESGDETTGENWYVWARLKLWCIGVGGSMLNIVMGRCVVVV